MPDGAQRAGAQLAVAFALFLALAETARNWGDWQWWPFWLVDDIASALLLAGVSPRCVAPALAGGRR